MSFKLWLSGLFARKKKPIRRTKRRDSIRLQLEQLEDRLVPTISIGGTSYATLQAAVNAATNGQTINIDTTGMPAGGYQGAVTISTPLTIAGPGSGQLPTIFAPTDGSLDGTHNAIFDVEGGASVTLSDLNITGSASDLDQGIYVGDGSTLTLASSSLQGIQNTSGNAVGVQVGNSSTGDAGIAFLSDDTIGGYQTAGIVIDGSGSSATIANTTVTGLSFAASAVQDGIIVSNGAVATISGSTVTDNSYLTGSMYSYSNSAGILFSSAGPGSSVTDSTVSGNVLGLVDFYSGSLTVAGSTWNNAYYNLAIDSASTTVIGNTLSGGTYGVAAFNQSGDTVDSVVNITGNTIANSMMAGIYATSSSTEAQPEVTANINYFGSSGTAVDNTTSNVIDATNNWWGSNSGPWSYQIAGSVTTSPYLVLNATMSASTVVSGQSLTLTADLTQNSNDQDTSYLGYLPNGIPVTFYGYNGMASPSTAYTVDGQASTTFTVGSASVPYAYGYANSGNATATADVSITQDGTTTSLSSSAGSAEYGQAATLTATVTAVSPGSGDATGYVYFYDGTDIIGSAYLSAGVATMTTTWLAVGDYSITAVYQGDGGYTASTSAACNLEVTEATTTTTITPSSDPAQLGQVVTFTAQVSAAFQGFSIPTGTVQFEIDGSAYGSPQTLGSNGQASIGISGLLTGPHTIVAVYSGDANYQGNTSDPLTETVANSVTTVASSLNPAQVEQNVTFTATVAAVVSGSGTPTGTVQFQVDGSNYGSPQTLDANGQATISDDSLAGGNYTITAIYSGDANFTASNDDSNPLTQVVVNDTTALSSSSDPSVVGQNVTLTANVSPVIGGATVPTGSVQFWDGSMELGTGFLDSTGTTTLTLSYLPAGADNLTAVYGGDSNYTPSTSPPLAQVVELIGTSTAVTSSANPVGVNQSLTLTATITPDTQGSGSPYGTVDFYDGTSFLGSSYAYGGVANLYLSSLSFGDHSITAVFEGNSTFASSTSGTYVQQVFSSGAVNLTSSASGTVVYGQSVTFTAVVSYASGAAVPTGTMTFWSGSNNLGTINVDDTGTATLTTTALPAGYDSIDAVYSGDSSYAGGVSNYVYQSVQQDSTTTSLGASSTDVVYSAPLTLTATVAANSPGSGSPTGSVTFYDSGSYLGTASLASGVASLTLSNLSVGRYPYITTVYNGDSNFTGSTSSDLAVTIAEDGTTTSVATSGSPSVVGENVTFTATISADSPGQGTPTGYVQFQIDGSDYGGPVWLYNGVASINDSSLSVASYTITASYSGDGNFTASDDTADPLTQIVNQAGTTTTLVTSPGSSVYGQSVAFTATVESASSSMFSPTGYVQFEVDGSAYGSPVQLSGGSATLNDAALSLGDPVITAVYLGDSNFTGSTSTSVEQTVAQDATWTSLSVSPQSSDFGQLVTLTATVYAAYPGSGTPTQTVTFMDGTNVLGTGTLSNGTATFSTATLSVGDHPSLTAIYGGDSNFTGSTSSSTDEEVYQAGTQTLLSASENPAAVGETVTFTATVSAYSPSGAVPTGSVQFVDQSTDTVLATVSLSNGTASFSTSSLAVGVHDIVANYLGTSSFWESSSNLTETVGYATTTTLAPSSGPSTFGQLVVLTATVTGSQGTPTGYVEFFDDSNELGSGYLNDGVASLYVYNLSGDNHTDIAAYYEGDGTNNPSTSAPIDQLVNPASTSIAVSSNLQPSEVGQSVTFTATITPSTYEASPTGTVQFYVDGTAYGSPQPVYGGQITITDATLTAGAHSITVVYSGDGNFSGSNDNSNPLSQTVVNSVTSVGSSSDPSLIGQDVTFTATVSPVITGAGTPTGTVQFQIDGSNYGSPQSLNGSGQAMIDDAALTPGGHTITAVYSGDANFTGSSDSADPLTQTVSSSTTSLISNPDPSVYGQSVTLTATVSPVLSGAPIPTGYVEFFSGQSMLGGSYLNDEGVATYSTTDLAVGPNSLAAVYQGDSNFTASTSATATQVVNQAATTTVVTSPNNPAGLNQDVEFFATVTPTAPGGGDVDGEVNFYDGSTFLGSSYAYGGVAYFYTSSLSLGNHNITANFVGSSDYGASDSAVLDEVILDSSSITLISSANDTVYGQSVTFTATVTALTGSNMPTGSVSFYNGSTLFGTATLNSGGVATLTANALPAGSDYVDAVYSGDSNFAGSTSGNIYQYVLQDATTTTLSGSPGSTVYSDPVALTATVTANSPGFGTPTGSVYFYDSGSYLGWAPLNGSGVATLSDTTLFVGNHPSITARYSGDSNFTYSSSSAIDETVAEDATTTSLTSSPNSSAPGQNVVFTATVSADSPGVGTPTGWVQFAIDGANYGQAWLNNGQASISDVGLSLGYHTITVSYSGDGNFAPSDDTANPLSQEVVAAPSVATNPANQTIVYTQSATFTAAASGFPVPTVQWEVSTDGGTTFTALSNGGMYSGVTTGTLTVNWATVARSGYEYAAVFTNDLGTATTNPATLTVNPLVITLANPGTETNSEGDTVNLSLSATDSAGNALEYTAQNLPQGLVINYVTGAISGTIWNGASLESPYDVTITAIDTVKPGINASTSFQWYVNPVVTLTNPGSETNADGDTVYLPLAATDSAGNPLTYSAMGLPAGLTINLSTGAVRGTVSAGDDADSPYSVIVTATDSVDTGANSSQTFQWTINPTGTIAVSLTPLGTQTNFEGDTPNLALSATDSADNALVYAAVGSLPPGLSLNPSTGVISGTVDDFDSEYSPYTVTVSATDSTNPSVGACQTFTWIVRPLVALTAPSSETNADGDTVYLPLAATDSEDNALNWSVTGGALPAGLGINPATGLISGTISAGADADSPYAVTVTATDSVDSGGTASQTIDWTVNATGTIQVTFPQPPADQSCFEGDSVSLSTSATDSAGNPILYEASNLPPGLTINPSTGAITGTVTLGDSQNSPYSVTVIAMDGTNPDVGASATFEWTIEPAMQLQWVVTTPPPGSVTAGTSFGLTVAAEDAQGDVDTAYSGGGEVTLTVDNGPSGTLGGTVTAAIVDGVATFNGALLTTAGLFNLEVSDDALQPATTSWIDVEAGAPAALQVATETPGMAYVNNGFALSVEAVDQYGNVVPAADWDTSSITAGIASGTTGATLSGPTSTRVSAWGNAVYVLGLALNEAGSYTLSLCATDEDGNALTPATTGTVDVEPVTPTQWVVTAQPPDSVTAGNTFSLTVTAEDGQGDVDTAYSGTVTLAVASGPAGGVLSGLITASVQDGVATFSGAVLTTTGNYDLEASDGVLQAATTDWFTVEAAAPAALEVATQPSTAFVDNGFALSVEAMDQYGNVVPTWQWNTSSISAAVASGPGALAGPPTLQVNWNTVEVQGLSLNEAGGYTLSLSATDENGNALTLATTGMIDVGAVTPTQWVVTARPRGDVTAGNAFSLTVTAEDGQGNVDTAYSGTVTLSLISGPGSLSGTVTATAVNGVATISGAVLTTTGSYQLQAGDGLLPSATVSIQAANAISIWTGAAGDSVFSDPGNWLGGNVPTSQSVAIIAGAGSVTFSSSVAVGTLVVYNSNITINGSYSASNTVIGGSSQVSFNGSAQTTNGMLAGGTLGGTGTFAINGVFEWLGGSMAGTGTTTVASGGLLVIFDSGAMATVQAAASSAANAVLATFGSYANTPLAQIAAGFAADVAANNALATVQPTLGLNGCTLINQGTIFWDGVGGVVGNGATVDNQGTFLAAANGTFGGVGVTFNNFGGASLIEMGVTTLAAQFNNAGTVNVLAGSLVLQQGGSSTGGAFQTGQLGELVFAPQGPQHYYNYNFDSATSFSGNGAVVFSGTSNCLCLANLEGVYQSANTVVANGASVVLNAAATVTNLVVASGGSVSFNAAAAVSNLVLEPGGTIAGPGTLTINNSFYWLGGTLGSSYDSTPGQTVIGSNAVMTVGTTVGMDVHSAVNRIITNNGVAVFEAGATVNFGGGVTFDNIGVAMLLSTSVALPASDQQQITANGSTGPVPTSLPVPVQIIGTSGANYFRNIGSLMVGSVGGPIAGGAIIFGMRFYNFGTVQIANGTLLLEAGDSFGTWIMGDNATLNFSNQLPGTQAASIAARFFFASGSNSKIQTSGAGSNATVIDSGATVQVYANLSVPNFDLLAGTGGTLNIAGSLTVTTRMLWIGGTVTGGANSYGTLNVPGGAALYVIGNVTLGSCYLNVSGQVAWAGGQVTVTIGRSTVALIGFSAFTLPANGQLPPLAQMLQRLSAAGVQGPGPGILNPNSPGYNADNNPVTLLENGLLARSAPAASGAFGSLLANKSGLYRAILVAAYQLRFNTPLISDTPSFPSEATAVGQYVPASAVTKVASYLRNGTEATQPAPTPTSLGFWNGLNEFYLGASDGALMVYNAATFHSDTDVNNYVNSITPQYGQAANVIAHIGVYSAYAAIALAAAPYVASGARAGYSAFMANYPAMYVWASTPAGSAVIGGTIAGIASGGDPAAIAEGAFLGYVSGTPRNAPSNAGRFPANPAQMTAQLGVPPARVGTTPDGTPRVVWEPNSNTRIRFESHPGGLSPGGPGFNPRHHGPHYHVEIKPDGLTWGQANRRGLITTVEPPGYTLGSGTGFLPGEFFPGQ